MCGIGGFSGRIDPGLLRELNRAMGHRGPDDSGIFVDSTAEVGLAHVRLSILDLSPLGHQPMTSMDGDVVLVFNGEIYNFRELRAGLESRGYVFRGNSDTEVLLNLYLSEGEAMLPRINGIFAFAIWDRRNRSLLLARDALGVKPLYFAVRDTSFVFASEVKALLKLAPDLRELDALSLHRYLSFLWCPGDGTPLKEVRKLLPGEAMIVRSGKIERRWSWYQLPAFRPSVPCLNCGAALEGTVTHLRQAVQRQMVADVPLGAFLSGGLDSSAIVAFAREQNPNIHCYTIESDGLQEEGIADDLAFARRVAQHFQVPLEVVKIDAARMAGDLEFMVAQLDEPLADPAALNVFYISQLARSSGMKVLLSGAGGDDLFTGYRRHRGLMFERYWSWLPRGIRVALTKMSGRLDQRQTWGRRLAKLFAGASLEPDERLVNYFRWTRESDLFSLYSSEFRRSLGTGQAAAPMLDFLRNIPQGVEPLERMLALEQRFFLADHNLIYTDKMSMAAGVEVRVPFLDMQLVDFAATIPPRWKQRGKVGKWIFKKAMEPYLPHDVIYRPKSGFGAPVRLWMRRELREMLGDFLSVDSLQRRGLFDPQAVQRLIELNATGKRDASYTLLSLLCIEIWCRTYLDGCGRQTTN